MATIRNGVNVDDLMTAIEAVKEDQDNGKLIFKVVIFGQKSINLPYE